MTGPQSTGFELFSAQGLPTRTGSQSLLPATVPGTAEGAEVTSGEGFGWLLALVTGLESTVPQPFAGQGQLMTASAPAASLQAATEQGIRPDPGKLMPENGKMLPLDDAQLTELMSQSLAPREPVPTAAKTGPAMPFMLDAAMESRGQRVLTAEQTLIDTQTAQESEEGVLLDFRNGSNTATARNSLLPAALPASQAQQPDFNQAVGQRLLFMIQSGSQDARLKVHPANLGSIDIQLSLDGDEARLSLASPHSSVRDALDLAVPRLREMLGEAGVTLGQVDVGAGDSSSANDSGSGSASGNESDSALAGESAEAQSGQAVEVRQLSGLVDTFA